MRKVFLYFLCFFTIMNISYASDEVNVKIPTFKTTINDIVFDNEKELYPLIVYKDITYFPMTYSLCENIGLAVSWDKFDGLYIANYSANNEEYKSYEGNNKKDTVYKAIIARYPIIINGLPIDNDEEEFPVLSFRDITYFPLTWRFANDEFGWKISWNKEGGLLVDTRVKKPQMYLKNINKNNAELQVCKNFYEESIDENGDKCYTLTNRKYYNYSLDYSSNSLIFIDESDEPGNMNEDEVENVSDGFELRDGTLYYNDREVENFEKLEVENIGFSAEIWEYSKENIISLCVYLDETIPAPYTPHTYYTLVETEDKIINITAWDKAQQLDKVYKTGVGYYLCSDRRYLNGRFYNGVGMIAILNNTDYSLEIINDRYKDYNSIKAIGFFDEGIYVLATYFPDKDKIMATGKVSAINDGYFYMSSNGEMTRIHDFIDGEAFVTKDGSLYCIRTGVYEVVNLTTGKRARL